MSEFAFQANHTATCFKTYGHRSKMPAGGTLSKIETRAKMRFIDNLVAQVFHVPRCELCAPTRRAARTAFARQVAMYLAHVVCAVTLTHIGKYYGRDRTTVAHACRTVEDRRDDPNLDVFLDFLEGALRAWVQAQSRSEAA